jgi:hypothetical protein
MDGFHAAVLRVRSAPPMRWGNQVASGEPRPVLLLLAVGQCRWVSGGIRAALRSGFTQEHTTFAQHRRPRQIGHLIAVVNPRNLPARQKNLSSLGQLGIRARQVSDSRGSNAGTPRPLSRSPYLGLPMPCRCCFWIGRDLSGFRRRILSHMSLECRGGGVALEEI